MRSPCGCEAPNARHGDRQLTGDGARALRRLEAAYPVAMAYLAEAYRSGQAGRDLRTYGGGLVPMSSAGPGAAASARTGRGGGARPLRAQCAGPGSGGGAVQGVGGNGGPVVGAMAPRSCCAYTTSCWSTSAPKARWPWLSFSTTAFTRPSATRARWCGPASPTLPLSSAGLMPRPPVWLRAGAATSPKATQNDSGGADARRPPVTEHSGAYTDDGLPRNSRLVRQLWKPARAGSAGTPDGIILRLARCAYRLVHNPVGRKAATGLCAAVRARGLDGSVIGCGPASHRRPGCGSGGPWVRSGTGYLRRQ